MIANGRISLGGESSAELPHGWRWMLLGEHTTKIGSGITPRGGSTSYLQEGIPLIRSQNIHMNRFERTGLAFISSDQDASMAGSRVQPGDVLLNITGASIGRVCVVPQAVCPANVNQHVSIIRCAETLDPDYLAFYIAQRDFQKLIIDAEAGATRQALTKQLISNFSIAAPARTEQERIAGILKEQLAAAARAGAAARLQQKATGALALAYLRAVFQSDEARSWPTYAMGDLSTLVIDGPHVTPEYRAKGVPFLTVRNIVNRRIDFSDVSFVSEEDHAAFASRGRAERGDILYTKDGTLGVPCVVDTDEQFSFFVSVALIKLQRDMVDPHFVAYALDSPAVLKQVSRLGAGAGLKHMVLRSIRALVVPVPPLVRQREIVKKVREQMAHSADIKKALESQVKDIETMPAALLRAAFQGRL